MSGLGDDAAPHLAGSGAGGDPNTHTQRRPAGVVLAGGLARRMGRNKALLELGGETLVARAARHLAGVADPVLIADRGRGLLAEDCSVADGPGAGPISGLLGAAAALPGRRLLALACDLPAVDSRLLAHLAVQTEFDWVVPESERGPEPLVALYSPAALAVLGIRAAHGAFGLHTLGAEPGLRVLRVRGEILSALCDPERCFLNVNAPEDWHALLTQEAEAISRRNSKR